MNATSDDKAEMAKATPGQRLHPRQLILEPAQERQAGTEDDDSDPRCAMEVEGVSRATVESVQLGVVQPLDDVAAAAVKGDLELRVLDYGGNHHSLESPCFQCSLSRP